MRDTWQSQAQVTLSAVEGGLSGTVGTALPGVGMFLVNADIGIKFGQVDRALEYHEMLFADYKAWLEVVNDLEAELWDIAWSVVPDVVVAGGSAIKRKIGGGIAEAAGKGVGMPVARDVVDDFFDDVKGSYTNGNPLEIGEYIDNSAGVYRNANGVATGQLPGEMPTTAGSSQGVSGVLMDGSRSSTVDLTKAVVGGKSYGGEAPDVGNHSRNPGGVYDIVPGDMDHAITSQLTTDVKSAASSSKDAGGIRVDGSHVPEVDTARAVDVGEPYGVGTSKVNPSDQAPKVNVGGGEGDTGLGEGNEALKRKDITDLLNSGKTPDNLLKAGYSIDDLLKAGVAPDDLPGYQHLVTGEGLVRKKAQVVGGHNIDSFYEAIKQDAQNLGLDVSDYNIKITEHSTIKGLYQIEYSIPRVNGNTNPLTPLYDNAGELLTKSADDFKTVYNTTEIGFGDIEIYAMGKQALEAEILAGNVSGYTVQATINGITFKGYYRNGVLTNFFPIFE